MKNNVANTVTVQNAEKLVVIVGIASIVTEAVVHHVFIRPTTIRN
jgi:hypothetical protein